MSELKKIAKITDSEIKKAGVQSLADRPNRSSQYGTGGLTAGELKKAFDSLASLIASRVNGLIDGFGSNEATDYIKVALGEYQTLGDIIRAIESGDLAKKLKVNPFASATWTLDLQSVINDIAQDIANIKENSYISEEGLEAVFSQISYNINALNSDKKYLVKLKLHIDGVAPGDYSFNIPTDEEFAPNIMPGLDGNDVFKVFNDQTVYTADIGSFYGVLALTFSTSQNTFFATLLENVDGKLVAISYPVSADVVLEEEVINNTSASHEDIASAVAREKGEREQADEALGGRIDTEASDRLSADEALGTRITNEENARSSAVSELDGKISAEKSAREAADTSIRESVAANKSGIDVLNGSASTEGSVKKQISDAIAAIMENPDASMNSIQELVDWINDHASDALELSNKASANETAVGKINALLGTSLPATTNASTVIGYITEIADKLATETAGRLKSIQNLREEFQAGIDAEASARATEISGERTQRMNMDSHIRENAVFGVVLSGQDLVFRNDHGVELQNNRITLPSSFGGEGGGSAVATLPIQYLRISDPDGYNVVKLSESLYGARLLLTSYGAACTYGTTRKVPCANWSEIPTQDFTVVVGDSPLHTDYYHKWDYSEPIVEGLAYMVKVTLNRSSGLLTITTTSRNFLSYFPEFDYYVELEINTAIKRAMVRVTQLKIY